MTGPLAILGRAVSFILDPVPKCDRKQRASIIPPLAEPLVDHAAEIIGSMPGGYSADVVRAMIEEHWRLWETMPHPDVREWPLPIEWPTLDELAAKHPRSSPARLRPYNWQAEHAWPVEGWVL